jgi:SAM-dependent methyltransferase
MPVVLGDVTCLPFDDRSFDGVVCGEVIEHIPDDVAALAEMRRVLVPGGVVLVSVPANPWRYDWFDRWAGHVRRYTPEALEGAFRAAGLVRPEAVGWGFPMTGLYHRHVFMPMLRRRLERAGEPPGAPSTRVRRLFPVVRAALELDTLLLGRAPGWFGLIGVARAPG